jgi:hypothetical protein
VSTPKNDRCPIKLENLPGVLNDLHEVTINPYVIVNAVIHVQQVTQLPLEIRLSWSIPVYVVDPVRIVCPDIEASGIFGLLH